MSYPTRPPPPSICMPVAPGMPFMPPMMMPVPPHAPASVAAPPPMRPFHAQMPPPTITRPPIGAPILPNHSLPGVDCMQTLPPNHSMSPPSATALASGMPATTVSSSEPTVTVFIGNIADNVPEPMLKAILAVCGPVINWKRVKTFGFCEFSGAEAGLCAISFLHDLQVGDKKLVAKVDAKTKDVLDQYKIEKRKSLGNSSPLQDEKMDVNDFVDENMENKKQQALVAIKKILADYEEEMANFEVIKEEENVEKRKKLLHDVDMEEGKKDLISREIGKFRENMKKQEEQKEVNRRQKQEKDRRDRSRSPLSPVRDESPKTNRRRNHRSVSRDRDRDRERERERERERDRDREWEREREREREMRERDREREIREREREREKSPREVMKEREIEEEMKEKKKLERKTREKEAAYQERLKEWEAREKRKMKEYAKEAEKERLKVENREKEAIRIKEFLEDYDDERDDPKYYKGKELQRKMSERIEEAEADTCDRTKEKLELEELKTRIFSEKHEDPNAAFEKAKNQHDEKYKPKIFVRTISESSVGASDMGVASSVAARKRKQRTDGSVPATGAVETHKSNGFGGRSYTLPEESVAVKNEVGDDNDDDDDGDDDDDNNDGVGGGSDGAAGGDADYDMDDDGAAFGKRSPRMSSNSLALSSSLSILEPPVACAPKMLSKPIVMMSTNSSSAGAAFADAKKKKLELKEMFNADDDDDDENDGDYGSGGQAPQKKRKLVPLDYEVNDVINSDDQNISTNAAGAPADSDRKSNNVTAPGGTQVAPKTAEPKTQEEKRRHIKNLIDRIPTAKKELFEIQLDLTTIDSSLMEKRIRPWINKKIIEYIGEPEPALVDFICSKISAGSSPQTILDDVKMVLDDEAEVFVVKMWRLLIYETEAKKLGLLK